MRNSGLKAGILKVERWLSSSNTAQCLASKCPVPGQQAGLGQGTGALRVKGSQWITRDCNVLCSLVFMWLTPTLHGSLPAETWSVFCMSRTKEGGRKGKSKKGDIRREANNSWCEQRRISVLSRSTSDTWFSILNGKMG